MITSTALRTNETPPKQSVKRKKTRETKLAITEVPKAQNLRDCTDTTPLEFVHGHKPQWNKQRPWSTQAKDSTGPTKAISRNKNSNAWKNMLLTRRWSPFCLHPPVSLLLSLQYGLVPFTSCLKIVVISDILKSQHALKS